eukprot:TRINITY_DN67124_c0_g1_i1.p1 TRINITY_DN67124_c0_g1~~TRINITY_DN67124_c0_g1_i1.p1  ORF type:complete len:191 (-),score=33.03 TRINITY_DN67124_c0_g1_i1:39-611(-)
MRARLGSHPENAADSQHGSLRLGSQTPSRDGAICRGPSGAALLTPGAESPDALDEWYQDPWAAPQRSRASTADSGTDYERSASRARRSPKQRRSLAEEFSLEQPDASLSAEVRDDPHWQYGRCVCSKLVSFSPRGCSAFEQLLLVLMTVFQLTQEQREEAQRSRQERLKVAQRPTGGSWLSTIARAAVGV